VVDEKQASTSCPGRVFVGAAAMARVDNDEIEEVRRELLEDVVFFLCARDGLVEGKRIAIGMLG
jgi:hypothetical protein